MECLEKNWRNSCKLCKLEITEFLPLLKKGCFFVLYCTECMNLCPSARVGSAPAPIRFLFKTEHSTELF